MMCERKLGKENDVKYSYHFFIFVAIPHQNAIKMHVKRNRFWKYFRLNTERCSFQRKCAAKLHLTRTSINTEIKESEIHQMCIDMYIRLMIKRKTGGRCAALRKQMRCGKHQLHNCNKTDFCFRRNGNKMKMFSDFYDCVKKP